jgi:hypothetical protein
MENNRIAELVAKYNEGLADPSEIRQIEQLIESGEIRLTQLRELEHLDEQLQIIEGPVPSMALDHAFYSKLSEEKRKSERGRFSFALPEWNVLFPRLALATSLIVVGFAGGYFLQKPAGSEVHELSQQVSDLKEMMMLSLLEKESATDRLKAVSLTSDMGKVSEKVTGALFKTLNEDENANVRLAALEVLAAYSRDSRVRMELIKSISIQDSPLVQVALAELMVSIQEKKSVSELQKLLQNKNTPKEVKSKIEKSINVLI